MQNFTEEQKEELQALVEAGAKVFFLAYNPATVVDPDPEADPEDVYDPEQVALDDGLFEYYREDTANLVEIIYLDEEPPEE